MPAKVCLEPSCPNPATWRGRCPLHTRQRNRQTRSRNTTIVYGKAKWRNTRKKALSDSPLCSCGQIATDVHHIVDIQAGGDPWAMDNLATLCHSCHARITRARQ